MRREKKAISVSTGPGLWAFIKAFAATTLVVASCSDNPEEAPAKLDLARFERVLVAGFVTQTTEVVDLNRETVRLLREQLRHRSTLQVIDAETVLLDDLPENTLGETGRIGQFKRIREEMEAFGDEELSVQEWIDSQKEKILADRGYWKKLGERYEDLLIISGKIKLVARRRSPFLPVKRTTDDGSLNEPQLLRRGAFEDGTAFILNAQFHFIDGRTGQLVHRERFIEEILYRADHAGSGLSAYFELMHGVVPYLTDFVSEPKRPVARFLFD